jgi:phosphoribosylpyrophosphate synthetase
LIPLERLVKAAEVLKERGAKKVYAYCTHPIFSGPRLNALPRVRALDEVVVTNTIPLSQRPGQCQKIRQVSVAPLIAETIQRIAKGICHEFVLGSGKSFLIRAKVLNGARNSRH